MEGEGKDEEKCVGRESDRSHLEIKQGKENFLKIRMDSFTTFALFGEFSMSEMSSLSLFLSLSSLSFAFCLFVFFCVFCLFSWKLREIE